MCTQCVYMHICIYVYMYICICMYIYIYNVYTNIYIYIHRYIYIYILAYSCRYPSTMQLCFMAVVLCFAVCPGVLHEHVVFAGCPGVHLKFKSQDLEQEQVKLAGQGKKLGSTCLMWTVNWRDKLTLRKLLLSMLYLQLVRAPASPNLGQEASQERFQCASRAL